MSVFSIIKRGRAQAKAHSAGQTDKKEVEAVKLPYKHVPTHAATDALATAPSSWKQDDRPRIREQNRKRSAMAANGASHGIPRVGSSLAYVSYPSVYANPVVPLPKNYSYSSIPGSWRERMASTPEASEEPDYFSHSRDKGKGKEIVPSFAIGTGGTASPMLSSGRTSPLSSRAVPVTVGVGMAISVGLENSGGSEEEKEMRTQPMKNVSHNPDPRPQSSRDSSTTGERLHRLHPAHARKMSESHIHLSSDRHYPPQARSTYFSAPRPTSHRTHSADNSMQSVPAVPRQVYGHATSSAASSVTSIGMAISTAPTSAASTPPSSTVGDTNAPNSHTFQLPSVGVEPPVRRQRRGSLREYLRASTETIRLPSNEPPQPPASSTRGRRLSKSKPRQSNETERPTSVHRISAAGTAMVGPTATRSETMIYEVTRLESKTRSGPEEPSSTLKQKHTRGRLSKDRPPSKDRGNNTQTDSKPRWALFGRRNSITGT
ncbi:hypothetical protein SAMD00023353_0200620 [Rosellinia necatrix]|uniref:Uncharacterized protein n=1 Tax=Rosellinia necatrix TaxID=77044 RepID=A0A1S7UJW9_ROSNE|nr:hypothetical protein SAMD00023353_0200620 [Rosellinia necatrix]